MKKAHSFRIFALLMVLSLTITGISICGKKALAVGNKSTDFKSFDEVKEYWAKRENPDKNFYVEGYSYVKIKTKSGMKKALFILYSKAGFYKTNVYIEDSGKIVYHKYDGSIGYYSASRKYFSFYAYACTGIYKYNKNKGIYKSYSESDDPDVQSEGKQLRKKYGCTNRIKYKSL